MSPLQVVVGRLVELQVAEGLQVAAELPEEVVLL